VREGFEYVIIGVDLKYRQLHLGPFLASSISGTRGHYGIAYLVWMRSWFVREC
jgi:hypothetical protein